jgi:hypothetical protein
LSSDWYLINSTQKFYSGFEDDEFNTLSTGLFEELVNHSPEAYDVTVGGLAKRVIIQSDNDENKRVLLSKIDDIKHGDLVVHKSDNWLVITSPDDDKINDHSEIQLCNSTLTIPGDTTKTQTGEDWRGAPVYDETSTSPTLLPCIAESKVYLSQGENQEPINLPNGRILVTIPYTDNSKITLNFEFEMYGHKFITVHVDRSQVINNAGIIQLTADLI